MSCIANISQVVVELKCIDEVVFFSINIHNRIGKYLQMHKMNKVNKLSEIETSITTSEEIKIQTRPL